MVIDGAENTLTVTMQQMTHHTEIVAKPCQQALVIADMPFKSYENAELALDNARCLIAAGANMVKLEGGSEHCDVFRLLNSNNINVCGHLGLHHSWLSIPVVIKFKARMISERKRYLTMRYY